MATLAIRGVDPTLKERLRVRAARHGRSMEAEGRQWQPARRDTTSLIPTTSESPSATGERA